MQKLTDEQWARWATDGYLQLEGVLSPTEVASFSAELDRIRDLPGWEPDTDTLPRGHYAWLPHAKSQDPEGFMDRRDLLTYGKPFIDLIDRPAVFDLVVDIMGPYVLHSMSQAIVRASTDDFPGYTHTDGGEALRRIRVTETSRPLAMKAMYLLSDVTGPESGNFTVFPGSHLRPYPEDPNFTPSPQMPGAVPLTGKAGDCYLFSHSLWHGPSPNHSGKARKTLLYNYCQMFLRLYDFALTSEVTDQCTPRQRRLLGDLGYDFRPGSYFYAPEDQVEVIHQTA
tara:strand:- start:192 stop:1040 length:849 start_codon:yes stop_codon:yes gene_type:complete